MQRQHPTFYIAGLLAALLLAALVIMDARVDTSGVRLSTVTREAAPQSRALRFEGRVVTRAPKGVAHSPALIEHPDGSLQAIWFQGTTEAGRDVALWSARLRDRKWSDPVRLFGARDDSQALGYRVKTIGNPALFHDDAGTLWLAYVNPSIGGWATSRIALRRSADDGETWSPPRQLVTSPLLGMSTLVRFAAVPAGSGLSALPAYHELVEDYPFLLLVDGDGRLVGTRRIGAGAGTGIQPLLIEPRKERFAAIMRPMRGMPDRLHLSESGDGGITWSQVHPTSIESNSAPACGVTMANGSSLLAYNPDPGVRDRLAFLHIDGESGEWRRLRREIRPRAERGRVSYCTMIERRDGSIAMVFTDTSRRLIRSVEFTPRWLARQLPASEPAQP